MSREIQKLNLVPGCKAIFVDGWVPHTGIVDKVYNNIVTFRDVTFLDRVLDYEYRDRINPTDDGRRFLIAESPNLVYRTGRFYLPKYPSVETQLWMSALMNGAAKNQKRTETNIKQFMDLCPENTLLGVKNKSSKMGVVFHPEHVIELNGNHLLLFNNDKEEKSHLYQIWCPKEQKCFIKKYTRDSYPYPEAVIVPKWCDDGRYLSKEDIEYAKSAMAERYPTKEIPFVDDLEFDEDHILQIFEFSSTIYMRNLMNSEVPRIENTFRVHGDKLIADFTYYDEIYKKR